MIKPAGCAFLGSDPTQIRGYVNSLFDIPTPVVIDSGSDITLISERYLKALLKVPKIRRGQRVTLVQVTGTSVITGYVNLDLYFPLNDRSQDAVKISVEAYVVKGMSTNLILGNDFAEQYEVGITRKNGQTFVTLGSNQHSIEVLESLDKDFLYLDDRGRTFKVLTRPDLACRSSRSRAHRKSQVRKRKLRKKFGKGEARSRFDYHIGPGTQRLVQLESAFPSNSQYFVLERSAYTNNPHDSQSVYSSPETIINRDKPYVWISNFSKLPITVAQGQLLGHLVEPSHIYATVDQLTTGEIHAMDKYSKYIQHQYSTNGSLYLQSTKGKEESDITKEECEQLENQPVTGGPKTSETPPESTDSKTFEDEVDLSQDLSRDQQERLRKVLRENQRAFALDGRLGNYEEEVRIPIKEGVKPISVPPYPMSPANRATIDAQMDSWLQLEVIESSRSPWAAPVFIVHRNGKPRMVIDLRRLNEQVIPDEFPLPRQEDILQTLAGSRYLSTLDALSGFTQLTIREEDREKLAFRTHRGLFQFKRMPFGYRNGPAVFQRVMQGILAPYLWLFSLVYIDDIVIFSRTFEDHLDHVDRVLTAIREAGITLSPAKCHFGYESLLLLGQKVSRLGLSTHKEKVDAINLLKEPSNVRELQTFLGMMVYFASYIPFYAWIVQPLFQLLKKKKEWSWGADQKQAFELAKKVLTNAPVRAHAMPGRPYRVYSDACDYALAAILQQVQPISVKDLRGTKAYERIERAWKEKEPRPPILVTQLSKENNDVPEDKWGTSLDNTTVHTERVIAYWSRILQPAERNYSPTEREALALKEGLIKFQPLLEGEEILAVTDHAALTWCKTFQNVNRRLLSWGLVFAAFPNMKIVHRAGRVHSNVDPISRLRRRVPRQDGPIAGPDQHLTIGAQDPLANMFNELAEQFEKKLLTIASRFSESEYREISEDVLNEKVAWPGTEDSREVSLPVSCARNFSVLIAITEEERERWEKEYQKDKYFRQILDQITKDGTKGTGFVDRYRKEADGLVYFRDNLGNLRLCVPMGLVQETIREDHDTISEGAHGGFHRTYNRLAARFYWPSMSRSIKKYVSTCDVCQKVKPRRHAGVGLLQPIPIPTQPFEVVSMDFITELPKSVTGHDSVLVIVDKLTKYVLFIPTTTSLTEKECARLFFRHVVTKFGIPRQIISDRDTRWRGEFWREVCELMGMRRALTTAYHPQADGQTEIVNQYLEIALRAFIGYEGGMELWDERLDVLALSFNTSPHSSTGFTPSYLLRGYHPLTSSTMISCPESITRPRETINPEDVGIEMAAEMVEAFENERNRAQDALIRAQLTQERYYNQGRILREFEVGDLVLVNQESLGLTRSFKGRGQKLLPKYEGPFEVSEKLGKMTYRLRLPGSYGIHPVINMAHLEPYHKDDAEGATRPTVEGRRGGFEEFPEFEVEAIIDEKWRKLRSGRKEKIFRVRYKGFGPDGDTWEPKRNLRNATETVRDWERRKKDIKKGRNVLGMNG